MKIDFHKKFKKQYDKLTPKERQKFNDKLSIFVRNPFDVLLNNHGLNGNFKDYRSINITVDLRAIYKIEGGTVIFVIIDTHSNLY